MVIFGNYRTNAARRGIPFELSIAQVVALIERHCFYCGVAPEPRLQRVGRSKAEYASNGIDRLDSGAGYTTENAVPCCAPCNYLKRAIGLVDFIRRIRRIAINTSSLRFDGPFGAFDTERSDVNDWLADFLRV